MEALDIPKAVGMRIYARQSGEIIIRVASKLVWRNKFHYSV